MSKTCVVKQSPSCAICESLTVFKCGRCKKIFYCSRPHQILHWNIHKHECIVVKHLFKSNVVLGPKDCFINLWNLKHYDEKIYRVLDALMKVGVCVIDNYFHTDIAHCILVELESLYLRSEAFQLPVVDKNILSYRSDYIAWMDNINHSRSALFEVERSFDMLIHYLTTHKSFPVVNYKIYQKSKMQLSCSFAGNIGYKKHIDNPCNNGRLLTCTFFCNINYVRKLHEGVFRFYVETNAKVIDVEPVFNRAVIFWSDSRIIHECFPSKIPLFSITMWYFNSPLLEDPHPHTRTLINKQTNAF